MLFLLFFLLFIQINCYADTSAAMFLEIPSSAKAVGMGDCFTALADDPFGAYYNPAGISFIKYPTVSFLYQNYIQDMSDNSIGIAIPGKVFSFNLSPSFIAIKEEPIYDSFGNDTGRKFRYQATIVPFSAAVRIKELSFGGTIKYYKEELDTDSKDVTTFDAGAIYRLNNLSLGISELNMTGKLGDYDLPRTLKYGLCYKYKDLNLLFDYNSQLTINKSFYNLGGEFLISNILFVRCGYRLQDTFGGLAYGLGIKMGRFDIDYAASSYSDLGTAQTLGLNYNFGREKGKKEELPKPKEEPIKPKKELVKSKLELKGKNTAISEFLGKNASAADASIVTDFIRTEMVSSEYFNILERANMEMILAEQKFQLSGCTSQECAVKMGKVLNVQLVLIGSLSKLLETYYITVSLVDVETGKVIKSIDQKAMTADELKDACKTIVQKLIK